MNIDEYVEKLLDSIDLIRPEDIPNIDLYMDQVTTFMEDHLGRLKRFEDDKILTKTMINNYAKNDLLPAPIKKKYSKDHLLLLTFIYYFKSFLTIGDIQTMTGQLTNRYFHSKEGATLSDIYSSLLSVFPELSEQFKKASHSVESLAEKCINTLDLSDDNTDAETEYLKNFFTIALLGLDVYMKKQLIESLIDSLEPAKKSKAEKNKNEKTKDKE